MNDTNTNNIHDVINLAMSASEAKHFNIELADTDLPAVLVPEGYELKTFPEHRSQKPRVEDTVEVETVEAWLNYWNQFADTQSIAFFNLSGGFLDGIIDYHATGDLGRGNWCKHRVIYRCPQTPEWKRWSNNSGVSMNQQVFARFIEDAVPDITEPAGAEMLEIASSLQAHNKVNFRQAIRLDNGETQFTYEENIEGKAGAKGQLKITQIIKIGIRLFEGGPGYEVEARFRYSIKDGNLAMWYDLVRPERVHEAAAEPSSRPRLERTEVEFEADDREVRVQRRADVDGAVQDAHRPIPLAGPARPATRRACAG